MDINDTLRGGENPILKGYTGWKHVREVVNWGWK